MVERLAALFVRYWLAGVVSYIVVAQLVISAWLVEVFPVPFGLCFVVSALDIVVCDSYYVVCVWGWGCGERGCEEESVGEEVLDLHGFGREDKMARLRNGPNFASMSRSYKYKTQSTVGVSSSKCNCRLIAVEMSREEGRLSFKSVVCSRRRVILAKKQPRDDPGQVLVK